MSDKFAPGDKVWAYSSGQGVYPPRGQHAAVVIERMPAEHTVLMNMHQESYEIDVPGVANSSGLTVWFVEVKNLRKRDDGPEVWPELVIETDHPNQKVQWDWKKELRVNNVEVPA